MLVVLRALFKSLGINFVEDHLLKSHFRRFPSQIERRQAYNSHLSLSCSIIFYKKHKFYLVRRWVVRSFSCNSYSSDHLFCFNLSFVVLLDSNRVSMFCQEKGSRGFTVRRSLKLLTAGTANSKNKTYASALDKTSRMLLLKHFHKAISVFCSFILC